MEKIWVCKICKFDSTKHIPEKEINGPCIGCDNECGDWYHFSCLVEKKKIVSVNDSFVCDHCLQVKHEECEKEEKTEQIVPNIERKEDHEVEFQEKYQNKQQESKKDSILGKRKAFDDGVLPITKKRKLELGEKEEQTGPIAPNNEGKEVEIKENNQNKPNESEKDNILGKRKALPTTDDNVPPKAKKRKLEVEEKVEGGLGEMINEVNVGETIKSISCDANGNVWLVNDKGNVFFWEDNSLKSKGGNNIKEISVGSNDEIWVITNDNLIQKWNNTGNTWISILGYSKCISVGSSNMVLSIDNSGDILNYQPQKNIWEKWTDGKFKQISVNENGILFGIGENNKIYKRFNSNSNWVDISTKGQLITSGDLDWIVNYENTALLVKNGELFIFEKDIWINLSYKCNSISSDVFRVCESKQEIIILEKNQKIIKINKKLIINLLTTCLLSSDVEQKKLNRENPNNNNEITKIIKRPPNNNNEITKIIKRPPNSEGNWFELLPISNSGYIKFGYGNPTFLKNGKNNSNEIDLERINKQKNNFLKEISKKPIENFDELEDIELEESNFLGFESIEDLNEQLRELEVLKEKGVKVKTNEIKQKMDSYFVRKKLMAVNLEVDVKKLIAQKRDLLIDFEEKMEVIEKKKGSLLKLEGREIEQIKSESSEEHIQKQDGSGEYYGISYTFF